MVDTSVCPVKHLTWPPEPLYVSNQLLSSRMASREDAKDVSSLHAVRVLLHARCGKLEVSVQKWQNSGQDVVTEGI